MELDKLDKETYCASKLKVRGNCLDVFNGSNRTWALIFYDSESGSHSHELSGSAQPYSHKLTPTKLDIIYAQVDFFILTW